jgi:hypothetical protein
MRQPTYIACKEKSGFRDSERPQYDEHARRHAGEAGGRPAFPQVSQYYSNESIE